VTPETWRGTALGSALDGMLLHDGAGGWIAMLSLQPPAAGAIDSDALRAALAASGVRDALVLDVRAQLDALYSGYFRRALLASFIGLVAIVALLAFALRRTERVMRAMVPFALGVLVAAALPLLFGTTLTLFHLVGLLLVAAIGSNYALFFERLPHFAPASRARTVASLVLANATTVLGFGILALSSIPVLHAIGSTVAVGAIATLVFSAMCARIEGLTA
jgi:predicted exporter